MAAVIIEKTRTENGIPVYLLDDGPTPKVPTKLLIVIYFMLAPLLFLPNKMIGKAIL